LQDIFFETPSKILSFDSEMCQRAALHGLGHHPETAPLIDKYVRNIQVAAQSEWASPPSSFRSSRPMIRAAGPQDRQQALRIGVVAECLIEMDKQITIPGAKNEASTELKRTAPESVLPVARTPSASPRFSVVASEEVEHVPRFQFCRLVRFPIGVDQQWESDSGFLAEQLGIAPVAESDRGQCGSDLPKRVLVLAQLRDVLATEDSAIVPQEDNHGGTALPNRTQPNFTASSFGQHDIREPRTDRPCHPMIICGRWCPPVG